MSKLFMKIFLKNSPDDSESELKELIDSIRNMLQSFEDIVKQAKEKLSPSDERQHQLDDCLHAFILLKESFSNDIPDENIIIRSVIFGLDLSGKTSILYKLLNNEFVETEPTIGYNVERVVFVWCLLF